MAVILIGAGALVVPAAPVPILVAAGGLVSITLLLAALWLVYRLARPVDQLARDLAIVARDNPSHPFRLPRRHAIGHLAAAAAAVRDRLASADERGALARATAELDRRQRQLEAILLDLTEGVVVCDLDHRVLLYNQAAAEAIDPPVAFGLGRSLLTCLSEEPVAHHLERLQAVRPATRSAPFVCATVHGGRLLQARMSLLRDADGEALGYVLTFGDIGGQVRTVAARDELLTAATDGQRALIGNLRAAAETLVRHGAGLEAEQRAAFERVILEESGRLSTHLDGLARARRELGAPPWVVAEVHSSDLIAALGRRLEAAGGPRLTATGLPQWLLGESLALRTLLEDLARRLRQETGIDALDIAVTPAGRNVDLDLVWQGSPVPTDQLDRWLDEPLSGGSGPLTGRAVLERHGTDAWSQPGRRPREALLRARGSRTRGARKPAGAATATGVLRLRSPGPAIASR